MSSLQHCIDILTNAADKLRTEYGVRSLRVFGSVARGEDDSNSDVDLFVDMPPKALKMVALKHYLQDILGRGVDLIRFRSSLDPFLLSEINKDGITIFT
ncbi:MAG: DNA polymerase subunit beta [Barnesiella sp.]|nr:DNA polymerase subunit beta [Bacteroidales bacterium]MBD5246757.1 DNA polymerase subunit beta [Barnesiella sp.]